MADFSNLKTLYLQRNHEILAKHVRIASSLWDRLKGLLGKQEMDADEALILSPCRSVHTFFMRFPIDVVFAKANGEIVSLYSNLRPHRLTWIHWRAVQAIELPAGAIEKWELKPGQRLKWGAFEEAGDV